MREIRSEYPRIGGYKLWLMLICLFGRENMPGRDSFLAILRRRGLMLPHPKARHTTNSNHRFHKWKNLTKGLVPTAANQLWVADITYILLAGGDVAYLHLITDAYSHMIVGWTLSGSLKAAVSIQTLQMALEQAIRQSGMECLTRLVHHSDRGIQYCCDAYVSILKEYGIRISMTEDYKPTDNAIAERANGIIKSEGLYPRKQLPTFAQAQEFISRFIRFYNCRRPHMSIGYKTPAEVHGQQGEQKRMWKSKFYDKNKVENQKECVSWQRQTEDPYKTIFTGLVAPPNLFPSSSLKLMLKMMNWQCETPTCPVFQEAYRKTCRLKQFYSKARSWFHSGGKSASLCLQTDFEWWKSAG